jgi:maleylacetate reductase
MDMIDFTYDALPGRVVFAIGAAGRLLPGEIERLGVTRLLLISTMAEAELAKEIASPFGERIAAAFTDVHPHVPVVVARAAQSAAQDAGAQALLSVGGGSTTGTAKAIALRTGLPIIAVPTTYAGSEMTPVWGLTEDGEKRTGVDSRVLPRVVVYDPELTFGLPVGLSAVSGLNALAHCVEAFWAPGRNPITSLMAEEGIRALAQGLPGVVDRPEDPTARSRTLYGAYLAGASFAVAGSGLHHKICHVLGGTFDLAHAETHAVVLPYVLAFNEPVLGDATAPIARAFGTATALAGLVALGRHVGAPRSLSELGMPRDGLERAAVLVGAKLPFDNPRPIRVSDVSPF